MRIIKVKSCKECPYCDGEWDRDNQRPEYTCGNIKSGYKGFFKL